MCDRCKSAVAEPRVLKGAWGCQKHTAALALRVAVPTTSSGLLLHPQYSLTTDPLLGFRGTLLGLPQFRGEGHRGVSALKEARLANYLDTVPKTVSRWERGVSLPSPLMQGKLTALFGWSSLRAPTATPTVDHPSPEGTRRRREQAALEQMSRPEY